MNPTAEDMRYTHLPLVKSRRWRYDSFSWEHKYSTPSGRQELPLGMSPHETLSGESIRAREGQRETQ